MNREEKAALIEEIGTEISEADAIFAIDYRGISVTQSAELRGKLREADASFRIVKNLFVVLAVAVTRLALVELAELVHVIGVHKPLLAVVE